MTYWPICRSGFACLMSAAAIRRATPDSPCHISGNTSGPLPNRSPNYRSPATPKSSASPAARSRHPECRRSPKSCCARTIACSSTTACTASSGNSAIPGTTVTPRVLSATGRYSPETKCHLRSMDRPVTPMTPCPARSNYPAISAQAITSSSAASALTA